MNDVLGAERRVLPLGEQAGTAPEDRHFRPDVEGLRAVAVLLVVLYHADIPHLSGGYIGVDVFFVISGFVITGLLLRERTRSGRTSIIDFYARRCRRILPAATVVIVATVLGAYLLLGTVGGNATANAARWAAAFLSNFHFASVGTNYFTSSLPPSPLQNYWSLSVEEQFYIVYPTLFLVVAKLRGRLSLRTSMSLALIVIIVSSYWFSVAQTATQPTSAYFSPFTRAWELALGALVAMATPRLKEVPRQAAALCTWIGLAAIAIAALTFTASTSYPGSLVAVPVGGAALIIAGGAAIPVAGAETLLGLRPFQWLGRRSYSLYLWHWPVLILAAERMGKSSLPLGQSLLLVLVAVLLASVTYTVVENPLRHWRIPSKVTVVGGIGVILATAFVLTGAIVFHTESATNFAVIPAADEQSLLSQVSAASHLSVLPLDLVPPLGQASSDFGPGSGDLSCQPGYADAGVPICTFGDRNGHQTMVVYGDSHAAMWLPALTPIATKARWKLIPLVKPDCPAGWVTVVNPVGWHQTDAPFTSCDEWHRWAVRTINRLKPNLVLVSQASGYKSPSAGGPASFVPAKRWRVALETFFDAISVPNARKVVIADTPARSMDAPSCVALHPDALQLCSTPVVFFDQPEMNQAEQAGGLAANAAFIDPTRWLCSAVCTDVVRNILVYRDISHLTATYVRYLQDVLGQMLKLQTFGT